MELFRKFITLYISLHLGAGPYAVGCISAACLCHGRSLQTSSSEQSEVNSAVDLGRLSGGHMGCHDLENLTGKISRTLAHETTEQKLMSEFSTVFGEFAEHLFTTFHRVVEWSYSFLKEDHKTLRSPRENNSGRSYDVIDSPDCSCCVALKYAVDSFKKTSVKETLEIALRVSFLPISSLVTYFHSYKYPGELFRPPIRAF